MNNSVILFLFLMFSSFTMANTVNINVYGRVTVSPCQVENKNYLIDFKKINISEFKNNQSTKWVDFVVKLKNCPISTKQATLSIAGVADPNNANYFINKGKAKGVALDLMDRNTKKNIKNGSKLVATVNQKIKSAEYPLSARVIKNGTGLTTGGFRSHLEFTLIYH